MPGSRKCAMQRERAEPEGGQAAEQVPAGPSGRSDEQPQHGQPYRLKWAGNTGSTYMYTEPDATGEVCYFAIEWDKDGGGVYEPESLGVVETHESAARAKEALQLGPPATTLDQCLDVRIRFLLVFVPVEFFACHP